VLTRVESVGQAVLVGSWFGLLVARRGEVRNTSLVIQILAGIAGGPIAAAAAHKHAFGAICHAITGLAVGFLSGAFLQTLAATMVTGAGRIRGRSGAWH